MEQTASSFGATWMPLPPANLQAGLPFVNLIDDAVVLFYSIIAHDPFKTPTAFVKSP